MHGMHVSSKGADLLLGVQFGSPDRMRIKVTSTLAVETETAECLVIRQINREW